jgi:hypothetical protein
MVPVKRRLGLLQAAMPLAIALLAAISASAQMAPTRTWEELKQETQRRVDKNLTPMSGLKSEDAREALSNIHSLDRDEWAASWSAIAERYEKRAETEDAAKNNDAARDDYFWAFRYYTAARWPTPNSSGKQKAYQNALAAFRNYGRYLNPPLEIVHVPFARKTKYKGASRCSAAGLAWWRSTCQARENRQSRQTWDRSGCFRACSTIWPRGRMWTASASWPGA